MSAEHKSRERITVRIGSRDCDYNIGPKKLAETEEVEKAIRLILGVLLCGDFDELRELFEKISYTIEGNQQKNRFEKFENKLSTSALEVYFHSIGERHDQDYDSIKDEIIEKLEQEFTRHLGPKKLFAYAMLNEMITLVETYSLAEEQPKEIEQATH